MLDNDVMYFFARENFQRNEERKKVNIQDKIIANNNASQFMVSLLFLGEIISKYQ